jgi:hypothetical protein
MQALLRDPFLCLESSFLGAIRLSFGRAAARKKNNKPQKNSRRDIAPHYHHPDPPEHFA